MTFHKIKALPFKPPRLIGLSEKQTVAHYENHYGAEVRRFNAIENELLATNWNSVSRFELSALKQAQLSLWNSINLHEVYFDSLGGQDGLGSESVDPSGFLADAIVQHFGGVANWHLEFKALADTWVNGAEWVVLQWNVLSKKLENLVYTDQASMATGGVPLLSIDLHEHAYLTDFGSDVDNYINTFIENIHWDRAAERFFSAVQHSDAPENKPDSLSPLHPEELLDLINQNNSPTLLDVCLLDDLPRRHDQLASAYCIKSDEVKKSIESLPKNKPVVAYCMYGFQVSSIAADELKAAGIEARILSGGISAWRAMGGTTVPYNS